MGGIWRRAGENWEQVPLSHFRTEHSTAVIYGSAKSVQDAPKRPNGCLRIVQNDAYQVVRPHIWIGMDDIPYFGRPVLEMSCPKFFRGPFCDQEVDGQPGHTWPETYFMSVARGEPMDVFQRSGDDCFYLWKSNTMTTAIHLALNLGFRRIAFAGIDLGGAYFDGRHHGSFEPQIRILFDQELDFLRRLALQGPWLGIDFINLSPTSRLAKCSEFKQERW